MTTSDDNAPEREVQHATVEIKIAFEVPGDEPETGRIALAEHVGELILKAADSKVNAELRDVAGTALTFTETPDEADERRVGEYEAEIERQLERAYERHVDRYGW
jgi:hypothetical protein